MDNKKWYLKGIKDGMPIALGYFAVAFTLGIAAKNSGVTAAQAFLATILTNASAGGYAGFNIIAENSGYLAMAVTQLVINARYLLMSCALSQKLSSKTSILHRIIVAFDVTDEIFALSVSVKGNLNPFYNYGAMTPSIPCWAFGTYLGVVMGNILPFTVANALSVGLYGMFLATIVPAAKKDKIILRIVIISMLLSLIFAKLPLLMQIPSGFRIIILTVAVSLAAALLFPLKEEELANEQ